MRFSLVVRRRRVLLAVALGAVVGLGPDRYAAAQATSLEIGLGNLEQIKIRFVTDKAKLHQAVGAQFDALVANLSKQTNLSATELVESIDRWKQIRKQLLEEATLPADPECATIAFDYATKLSGIYQPVLKKYADLEAMAVKQNRAEFATRMQTDRAAFEAQNLREGSELVAGKRWRGPRYYAADATTTHLFEVNEISGDMLRMTSHQDAQYSGHAVCEVSGKLTGVQFSVNFSKLVNGTTRFKSFTGVVIGKTMFVQAMAPGAKELMVLTKLDR